MNNHHPNFDGSHTRDFTPGVLFEEKYLIVELVGRGGVGSVYEVEQVFLKKRFALKTLDRTTLSENGWERFLREAKAASDFNHPGLVKVYEAGIAHDSTPYMVMDFIEGCSLAELVRKHHGVLALDEVLEIFIQAAQALSVAHDKGVVHRDIKPSNIMVARPNGSIQVKVIDFGIAKIINNAEIESISMTRAGEIFGTPQYMSPEQCLGLSIDHRTDIYSFGCALFEALTGVPPFIGDSVLSTMMKHHKEKTPTLAEGSLGRVFPLKLEKVVAHLLDKNPQTRYQKFSEVAADLQRIKDNAGDLSFTGPRTIGKLSRLSKPSNLKIYAYLACIVALTSGAWALGTYVGRSKAGVPNVVRTGFEDTSRPYDAIPKTVHPYSSFDSKYPQVRVFDFPTFGNVVGYLSVSRNTQLFSLQDNQFHARQKDDIPARGVIVADPFHPFALRLDDTAIANPQLLKGFRDDEVVELDCEGDNLTIGHPITDQVLLSVPHFFGLRKLDLRGAEITSKSIDFINQFPNLKELRIGRTPLSYDDLLKIRCFNQLEVLQIESLKSGNFEALCHRMQSSKDLKYLFLSRTPVVTDAGCRFLADVPAQTLCINANPQLTDEGMKLLSANKYMSSLSIAQCPNITDKSIKYFQQMPALSALVVSRKDWSNKSIEELSHNKKLHVILDDR